MNDAKVAPCRHETKVCWFCFAVNATEIICFRKRIHLHTNLVQIQNDVFFFIYFAAIFNTQSQALDRALSNGRMRNDTYSRQKCSVVAWFRCERFGQNRIRHSAWSLNWNWISELNGVRARVCACALRRIYILCQIHFHRSDSERFNQIGLFLNIVRLYLEMIGYSSAESYVYFLIFRSNCGVFCSHSLPQIVILRIMFCNCFVWLWPNAM